MPAPRPKVRKTQGLHNLGKGGQQNRHYLSTCKVCRHGVFKGKPDQPYRFVTGRVIGYVHDACLERETS